MYEEQNDYFLDKKYESVVSWLGRDIQQNRVNYLLTQMVQSNKYIKSRAVGVTFEVGLTTDRDLAELLWLRNTTSFIPPRYRKSRGTSHYFR